MGFRSDFKYAQSLFSNSSKGIPSSGMKLSETAGGLGVSLFHLHGMGNGMAG